jgi:hypothetical protein
MFSLSGFGTLGLVRTSTDDAQFALFGQTRGADKDVSAEVDSKLGVQVGAKFNDMLSGTVQVLTKSNGKGNFTPGVEWAFLKAQVTPGLSLRAGRMGAPSSRCLTSATWAMPTPRCARPRMCMTRCRSATSTVPTRATSSARRSAR